MAEAQTRLAMGHFLLNIMVVLALYTLTLGTLPYLQRLLPNDSAFVSVPLQAAFAVSTLHFMKKSGYSWRAFGLTLDRAGRFALEDAVFTLLQPRLCRRPPPHRARGSRRPPSWPASAGAGSSLASAAWSERSSRIC